MNDFHLKISFFRTWNVVGSTFDWVGLEGGGSSHIIQVNRVYWSERIQTNLAACAVIMQATNGP